MTVWHVEFHEDFVPEFDAFAARVQDAILARAIVLRELGPAAGRSGNTDSLKGSGFANMKELRVQVGGRLGGLPSPSIRCGALYCFVRVSNAASTSSGSTPN